MTRANSCCHEAQVRVGCRGRYCRSRWSKSANALADLRRGREGRPYPVEIRENTGLFHRPINWPVWSSVASIRKRLIPFVLLLVAAGCRQASSPATSQPQRGGELVASLRSEPANYNRYFDASAAADLMAVLTQARLVRLNRVTDALEPALAERWESAADGRTHTLHLRKGITFSDGAPFTAADVLFSFAVAYEAAGSRLGDSHHRRRPAAPGHLPGSVDRGHSSARGVRAGPPHPRQPADPAAPQARRRLPQRHDPEGLGAVDTVVRDGRGLAPSC